MCEYCGCQQIAVIDELTREHDAVVSAICDVRRALAAGSVAAAAEACRRISALLGPHTVVEEEGLFPCLAGEFPDHVDALRAEHRSIEAVLAEAAAGTPDGPHLAGPVAAHVGGPARAHPQGAGRRLPRRARRRSTARSGSGSRASAPASAPPLRPSHPAPPRPGMTQRTIAGGTVVTSTDPARIPGLDDPLTRALVSTRRFFTRAEISADQRTMHKVGGREGDAFYRDRWAHDKVVRSTHGVNCTGSCSWKVYVKDGIITWESQQTDYPSVGPGPARVRAPRLPPRRGVLLVHLLAHPGALPVRARRAAGDVPRGQGPPRRPGAGLGRRRRRPRAGPALQGRPRQGRPGPGELGGGHRDRRRRPRAHHQGAGARTASPGSRRSRRCRWCRTPRAPGSSTSSAARCCSFYDWYADLPVASPQVFGDQTDVPESGDWWDAGYLIMWGSNLPVTRTPDAHWMTEARYRGQKVIAVAPDYADNVKFADEWLPARPGTDGALAMAMGHVILKEFFVDRQVPYFTDYVYPLHRPAVPRPARADRDRHGYVPGKFLTAEDLGGDEAAARTPPSRPSCSTPRTGEPRRAQRLARAPLRRRRAPAGGTSTSATSRPLLSAAGGGEAPVTVHLPRFDDPDGAAAVLERGVPVRRVERAPGHHRVRPAAGAVRRRPRRPARRRGPPGTTTPTSRAPRAWQERITGVPAAGGRAGRSRVRGQRRGVARPLDDHHGGRDQPLVPLRHHLPRVPDPDQPDRLPGRQRRRLGALRRVRRRCVRSPATPSSPTPWTGPARRAT